MNTNSFTVVLLLTVLNVILKAAFFPEMTWLMVCLPAIIYAGFIVIALIISVVLALMGYE